MTDPAAAFGLFVSSVEGRPVARFGTKVLIGAHRTGSSIAYQTKAIVPIPLAEFQRFRREYMRAIANGSLIARDAAEWRSQQSQIQNKQRAASKLAKQPVGIGASRVDSDKDTPNDDPESGSE